MFIPIGDTPNPRNFTPWTNYALIAANVLMYVLFTLPLSSRSVAMNDPALQEYIRVLTPSLRSMFDLRRMLGQISAYDLFVFAHGYKPAMPQFADLFASLFLHANLMHLVGNMLFLWIYGDNVEYRLGRVGHLLAYLTTGVTATLFFGIFAPNSRVPLIGASGAISGVLGLYFLLFPRNRVKVFVVLFPWFFNTILLPARFVLGIYLIFDNLLPFVTGAKSGVAYGAHIGGFLAGLGIAYVGERFAWHFPWRDPFWRLGQTSQTTYSDDRPHTLTLVDEVRAAMNHGDWQSAVGAVTRMSARELAKLTPNECVLLASWFDEHGHPIGATNLLRQCLANHPGAENLAEVYLVLGLMRLKHGQTTAAYSAKKD